MALDQASNVYLAVTLNPTSPFVTNRESLLQVPRYESITDEGFVGSLQDVKLLKVPNEVWQAEKQDISATIESNENILKVVVQEPKMRVKRDVNEF